MCNSNGEQYWHQLFLTQFPIEDSSLDYCKYVNSKIANVLKWMIEDRNQNALEIGQVGNVTHIDQV